MLAGKQLLLEELPSDLRRELSDLKKEGEVICVQGVIKKASKYICQRCGNIEQRLFASFLCKRCSKVCTYCRKCITMGRVSECAVLVRGIHERKGERELHSLQWKGSLSLGQELAAQGVIEAIKQKESFYLGCVRGWKNRNVILRYRRGTSKRRKSVYRNAKDGRCTGISTEITRSVSKYKCSCFIRRECRS